MLTSIVIFAGFLPHGKWNSFRGNFLYPDLLSTGVFGFFISLDLFTMFLFYELAVIPMYLLIGIWGSGPKEYSAMKLTLMLMGGSAFCWWDCWDLFQFERQKVESLLSTSLRLQKFTSRSKSSGFSSRLPLLVLGCWEHFSRSIPGHPTVMLCTYCRFDASCRSTDETRRIRLFQRGYVPDAGSGA